MRQQNNRILVICLSLTLTLLVTCPLQAGDAFFDLFSQTKICFSHIAITKGWETEVAVINPTAKRVSGNFTFYDMDGNQLGEPVSKTLEANGRYQVMVGATFAQRGEVEYMIFSASTYGLKGYSKFSHEGYGIRASIMASAPQKSGLFTKIDHEGWTGIAFVNTSSKVARITLTAYSDAGVAVVIKRLDLDPGKKIVKTVEDIFEPQSVSGASYVSFTSDQGIVGFFLNGCGNKLDGSKAL